jgi:hypothetical protein
VPPHIVVDISGHGFGHAAMTLPVLTALKARRPDVRLTVRSGLAAGWLRARVETPFDYIADADFGMAMAGSLTVSARESLDHYRRMHGDWPGAVAGAAAALAPLKADLLLSNISYLSLAAAQALGIPCVAYSSLNWADVFWAYCGNLPGAEAIREQMAEAYAAADVFLQPEPSMPMPSIGNGRPVGPVVRCGRNRRAEVAQALGLTLQTRILLLSLGGGSAPIDYAAWPRLLGWHVIVGDDEAPGHPDVSSWSRLDMPFRDALASADALLVKPGYGLITEAVFSGKPLLYAPRAGWPENEAQIAWLHQRGRGEAVSEDVLGAGAFLRAAERLLSPPLTLPVCPDGAGEVAEAVLARL